MRILEIDGSSLTIEDVLAVARSDARLVLSKSALKRTSSNRRVLERLLEGGQVMYGINTGFGALSDKRIGNSDLAELQVNLLRSHATSVGDHLPTEIVRAMMLLRANSLLKGYSGVRPETLQLLISLLNKRVHPQIPQTGSVGASGDLSPLSHMALVLIGEGEAEYHHRIINGRKALESAGLTPVKLSAKEGLALNNGTQQMTAIGCLTLMDAMELAQTMMVALALSLQGLNGWIDAFNERIHALRPHEGQLMAARTIRNLLSGSKLVRTVKDGVPKEGRPQDPYSFRCAPQVIGASIDALNFARRLLEVEINSVTDNPIVFTQDETVLSGGNFHGQPIAVALDVLGLAISNLASLSERRVSCLLDGSMNNGLPPFLVGRETRPGLSSGLMAVQYTAAALVAESKLLTHPASSDSIPTSANFEDYVSMGPGAAMKAMRILDNSRRVVAIELLVALQAIDLRSDGRGLSPGTKKTYSTLRSKVPRIMKDRPFYEDEEAIYQVVKSGAIAETVRSSPTV